MPLPSLPEPTPLNLYLSMQALLSFSTSYLYLTSPKTSILKLGGRPSPTSTVLTQLLASGEALISYLCLEALSTSHPEARAMAVRAVGVYTVMNMATFWWGLRSHGGGDGGGSPKGSAMVIAGMAVGAGASVWWGVIRREGMQALI